MMARDGRRSGICVCLPLSTLTRARGSQLCRQLLLQSLRLDETARFLESRIESYNVHAHSTRLLRCSEVNKGCYSEVI